MPKGFPGHKYAVHLPIAVRARGKSFLTGVTEYMSSRDVRFQLKKPHALTRGTELTLYVSLPSGSTEENQVLVCARGRVLDVRRGQRSSAGYATLTAAMESYDFLGVSPISPTLPVSAADWPDPAA